MTTIATNNFLQRTRAGKLCTAFGIRLCDSPILPQIAKLAGFDTLFIELEHSSLSLKEASNLCMAGIQSGVTPFVRVPYQCGDGFVQRALDGGAMGVIFPHIHNKADAEAAVRISKYPPQGKRSMTGQLPQYQSKPVPVPTVIAEGNAHGSSVLLMIETAESVEKIDEIAAVEGVDVLLIGSNDLSIELGVPGDFRSEAYRNALTRVSEACHKHGKVFGLAGVYDNAEVQGWAVNELGARYILGQQDSAWITKGAKACIEALRACSEHAAP